MSSTNSCRMIMNYYDVSQCHLVLQRLCVYTSFSICVLYASDIYIYIYISLNDISLQLLFLSYLAIIQTEEILFDVEKGWMVSPRIQALLGDDWDEEAQEIEDDEDDDGYDDNEDFSINRNSGTYNKRSAINSKQQTVDTGTALRRKKPSIRVGKIELPKTVIDMLEKEARRQEKSDQKLKKSVEAANKRSTWTSLRIVGGSASGTRLRSPKDQSVRMYVCLNTQMDKSIDVLQYTQNLYIVQYHRCE